MFVRASKLPEIARMLDHTPRIPTDQTGTLELGFSSPIREKNSPSRAIANGTRADVRIRPFKAPIAESRNATETKPTPAAPRNFSAALVATGGASRYIVELELTTSLNGSA